MEPKTKETEKIVTLYLKQIFRVAHVLNINSAFGSFAAWQTVKKFEASMQRGKMLHLPNLPNRASHVLCKYVLDILQP